MRECGTDERRARILRRKARCCQIRERTLPRLFHRGIASDHGNRRKVSHALHGRPFAEKDLAAPDGAVLPIACAVKDEGKGLLLQMMLRHDRERMGVMMLDGIKGKAPLSSCFFSQKAGQVGRMQIGNDRLRRKPQELFPVLLRFQKKRLRAFIQDVAWHLGGIQRAAAREGKARRHVRPGRKDHAGWRVSHHRFREKSARPS